MSYSHDEIKEMLPDYINGLVSNGTERVINAHLRECPDCTEEMTFISGLMQADLPEPGELYWKTLPQKVRAISSERDEKGFFFSSLFRPAPAFAAAVLILIITIFSVYTIRTRPAGIDYLFEDPLAIAVVDISGVSEEDILSVIGETIEGNATEIFNTDDFSPHPYFMEFASLSSKELEGIYHVLEKEQQTGG